MDEGYNLYNLEPEFKKYLFAEKISPVSLKNYLSDFRHFSGWMTFKLKMQNAKLKIEENAINLSLIQEYKFYLTENNLPRKTVNRRLSTLRKFCSFCIAQGWMKENPAKQIQNLKVKSQNYNSKVKIESILDQFENDLKKERNNSQAITSYLDDVREFLSI